MNTYKYQAISKDGAEVSGVVEAYDEFEAVASIKENCKLVLKIDPISTKSKEKKDLNEPLRISDKVLSLASSQFAILLKAGLPAARTVQIVADQTNDKLLKRILNQVAADVAAGYPMSSSLESRGGEQVPLTFIETIRAGEESGTLDRSFVRLKDYYEKAHKIKGKVKSAMAYPTLLLVVSVVVVLMVINITVPIITDILTQNSQEMPIPTAILMWVYHSIAQKWWVLLTWVLAIAAVFILYKKTDKGRLNCAAIATKLPVLGKINRMKGCSQFANTMATLLAAGLPVSQAITTTARIVDNYAIGSTIGACASGIDEGKTLGSVLRGNPYLDPLLIEMTAVGEESGSLEATLSTIGEYFDSETEQATTRAMALMEPIMTVGLGIVIGFVVIALYMPMFTMYDGM